MITLTQRCSISLLKHREQLTVQQATTAFQLLSVFHPVVSPIVNTRQSLPSARFDVDIDVPVAALSRPLRQLLSVRRETDGRTDGRTDGTCSEKNDVDDAHRNIRHDSWLPQSTPADSLSLPRRRRRRRRRRGLDSERRAAATTTTTR